MNSLIILYKKFCTIPDKIRFLLIGGVNAAISYLIFVIAVLILGKEHYQLCVTAQWTLSSVISYLNQKFFVFCTKGNYIKEYLKCGSVWMVSYVINVILLRIFVKYIFKNVFISQIIALFLVSIITYVLFKYFAFKRKRKVNVHN